MMHITIQKKEGSSIMNEIIRKRKSIRRYDPEPLSDEIIEKIKERISLVKPLYTDIRYSINITNKTKGMFGVTAPHYLIFYSEQKEGYLENTGFVGQQMSLYFSQNNIGSCWFGMAKPTESGKYPFVICMAFGKAAEPLYRDFSDFKRKTLSEISEGSDERLESARLAPSGMNAQNWYFIAENNMIHCYTKKGVSSKLGYIDMGIALAHIAEESEEFSFKKVNTPTERKKYVYIGTVC